MNKHELAKEAARKAGIERKEVEKALNAALDVIMDEVGRGERVRIANFGVFERKTRTKRDGINPRTKEHCCISEKRRPIFRPGRRFKEIVGTQTA